MKPLSIFFLLHVLGVQATDTFEVVWRHDKTNGNQAISSYDATGTESYGYACGATLDSGNFETTPLSMTVDANGTGTITFRSLSHDIADDDDTASGIECVQLVIDTAAIVHCTVPWQGSSAPVVVANNVTGTDPSDLCFGSAATAEDIFDLFDFSVTGQDADPSEDWNITTVAAPDPMAIPLNESLLSNTTDLEVEKRQTINPCNYYVTWSHKMKKRKPLQKRLHRQVTEPQSCGKKATCVAEYSKGTGYSYTWEATFSPFDWVSASYAVTKESTISESHDCYNSHHKTVCVYHVGAYTSYRVKNMREYQCTKNKERVGHGRIKSPNKNNKGGGFYCVYGKKYCPNVNHSYWAKKSRKGGP